MSRKLRVLPQKTPLSGTITVPGDKSVSHRAVMLGGLGSGISHARRWLPAGDTRATLGIMRALGVEVEVVEHHPTNWELTIHGVGLQGLRPSAEPLDAKNAGTCIRLMAGILAGQPFTSIIDGSEQLRKRPMRRVTEPLGLMGATIHAQEGKAPLTIEPAPLHGIEYHLPVASAQVKSALLLAGLYAEGVTTVYEPGPARDHTERMLEAVGAPMTIGRTPNGGTFASITAPQQLQPFDLTVPADISSAAFPIVAALIVPNSCITIENVGLNPTRTGILEILQAMGAEITISNERVTGGEPAGDLTIRHSQLHATNVSGDVVVRAIDEFPVLAIAFSQAIGRSTVSDAAELRVKEVDRISVLAAELQKMGIVMEEKADGFSITGKTPLKGDVVDSHDDHRLAMSMSVAALLGQEETLILDGECVNDSFPGFVETMQALGVGLQFLAE